MKSLFFYIIIFTTTIITLANSSIKIIKPIEKTVVYDNVQNVLGKCLDIKACSYIFLEDTPLIITSRNFLQSAVLMPNPGKHIFFLTSFDEQNKARQQEIKLMYLKSFSDLDSHKLKNTIEILNFLGYFPDSYYPGFLPKTKVTKNDITDKNKFIISKAIDDKLTREEFAVLLFKTASIKNEIKNFLDWTQGFENKKANILLQKLTKSVQANDLSDKKIELIGEYFEITNPYENNFAVKDVEFIKGKVNENVRAVFINNQEFKIDEQGIFIGSLPIKTGKNNLNFIFKTDKGDLRAKRKILRFKTFEDIPQNHLALTEIKQLATLGFFDRYADNFSLRKEVIKEDLAYILAKAYNLPTNPISRSPFKDVPANYWAAPALKELAERGILGVYPDNTVKPKEKITRYQALIILIRAENLSFRDNNPKANFPFVDVDKNSEIAKVLQTALDYKIIDPATRFYGNSYLTRDVLAILLSRLNTVKMQIDELLDFNEGYNE